MTSSTYDFVIVGGGTSGLVVATRLTEDPNIRVLVLEAGEDRGADPRVTTPGLWPALLGTDVDWAFQSTPQTGMNGKIIPLSQGRLLGGSSAINGQAFVAPSKFTFDTWAGLGNSGWDWDTLAPYFQKSCTLTRPSPAAVDHLKLGYIDESTRELFTGPIQASFPEEGSDPLPRAWVETLTTMGFPMSGDPFSGIGLGGYINAMNIHPVTRQRSYASNAYYDPLRHRENLTVLLSTQVDKIILEGHTKDVIASGVSYVKDGVSHTVTASMEVILAAGVFNTPKLLELSGIGSAALLSSFDIPLVIDLPNVGENLQDHPNTGFSFEVRDDVQTVDELARQDMAAIGAAMEAYAKEQRGPFASGGNFAGGFLPLIDSHADEAQAHLTQLLQAQKDDGRPFTAHHAKFVQSLLANPAEGSGGFFSYPALGNFVPQTGSGDIMKSAAPGNYFTICSMLLHPLSRGTSHIASASPSDAPIIDPAYLTHPVDLEVLARHVRFIHKIAATEPLKSLLKPGGRTSSGGPANPDNLDEVKEYVKKAALSCWHPTSTCALLPRDKGGVVNERLFVYGTKNLRVVDSSVIPLATRGNCQTTVYAVAERAADLIKMDHGIKV